MALPNMQYWLDRKYSNLEAQTRVSAAGQAAEGAVQAQQARIQSAAADAAPQMNQAQIAQANADAFQKHAEGAFQTAQIPFAGALIGSQIGMNRASAANYSANAGATTALLPGQIMGQGLANDQQGRVNTDNSIADSSAMGASSTINNWNPLSGALPTFPTQGYR